MRRRRLNPRAPRPNAASTSVEGSGTAAAEPPIDTDDDSEPMSVATAGGVVGTLPVSDMISELVNPSVCRSLSNAELAIAPDPEADNVTPLEESLKSRYRSTASIIDIADISLLDAKSVRAVSVATGLEPEDNAASIAAKPSLVPDELSELATAELALLLEPAEATIIIVTGCAPITNVAFGLTAAVACKIWAAVKVAVAEPSPVLTLPV